MNASTQPLIKLDGVKKVFYTDEVETHALAGIHLEIQQGEYLAIAGPSGCGKSTLLAILGLLDTPTDGTYLLNGNQVANLSLSERARVRNREQGGHRDHVRTGEGGHHGLPARHHGTRGRCGQGDAPAQGCAGRGRQPVRAGRLRWAQLSGLGSGAARGAVARQDLPFSRQGCDGDVGRGNPRRPSGQAPLSPSRLVTRTTRR